MTDIVALSAHLSQAVGILYGTNPQAQHEADAWLTAFSQSSEAWQVCLGVLSAGNNAVEVLFYCCNTLLKKIRDDWDKLPAEGQAHVTSGVRERLQAVISHGALPQLVVSRLVLVVALAAVKSGEGHARDLVQQGLALAASGSNVLIAVELLTAVAEEIDALGRRSRQACVAACVPRASEVFAMVEAVVCGRLDKSVAPGAAKCLSVWLKLDETGAGGKLLSLADIYTQQHALLLALLRALVDDDDALARAAADVMIEIIEVTGSAAKAEADKAAVVTIMSALAHHQDRAMEEEHVGHAIARVATAVAEHDATTAAGGAAEALPLAQLMLRLLNHEERSVVEAALDYFLMINTVPLSERHPDMKTPLYAAMLEPLMRRATMSPSLQEWKTYTNDDEDSFHRFREQILTDSLDSCYGLLKGQYLAFMSSLMAAADTWQEAEACLFGIRCVAMTVKARALSERKADLVNPCMQIEKAEARAFLLATFGHLTSAEGSSVFWTNVLVIEAACRLIGIYAAWFGSCKEAPVMGALHFLLRALGVQQKGGHIKHAANALRNLCARCSQSLLDPAALKSLMDATESSVSGPSSQDILELEDRQAVVEGLARIVSLLPLQDAQPAAIQLVGPLVRRVQNILNGGGFTALALSEELQLISAAVRFMEFAGDGLEGQPHPALQVVDGLWPLLTGIAESPQWTQSADVIEALCSVYQRCIMALKSSAAPLLKPMVSTVVGLLKSGNHSQSLATLQSCAEVFGSVLEAAEILSSGFNSAVEIVVARIQACTQPQLAEMAEFVSAALQLSDRFLLFAPEALLPSPHLSDLLALAVRALGMAEREPVQAALNFATHLSAPSAKQLASPAWAAHQGQVSLAVGAHGEALVRTLLVSAAGSCPNHLLRILSGCVYGLLTSPAYRHAVAAIVPAVIVSADYPAVKEGYLKEEDCNRFCAAALKEPPLPRPRFDLLVSDFAAICRAQGTSDALLAFEV